MGTEVTYSASGNETDFLSRNSGAGNSGSLSNVLMVTTTMGMVNGIHSNTTSTGPATMIMSTHFQNDKMKNVLVTLGLEFVVCTTSLEQRLVDPSSSGNNADSGTSSSGNSLLGTTGQTDAGLVVVRRVSDDGGVVSRCAGKSTTIADLLLNVADDGTFRALADGDDVSDG